MKHIIAEYEEWVAEDYIWKTWEHEDYDNTIVYEARNGDIICIRRDENGKIVEAWGE